MSSLQTTVPDTPQPEVRTVTLQHPLQWLALAWRDIERAPAVALAHGMALALFGAALLTVAHHRFWLLAGALSGFLLVAPVLAVGLYAASRALEQGGRADFTLVLRTWLSWRGQPRHDWRLVKFGVLLALAGTGWVLTSASLITLLAPQPVARGGIEGCNRAVCCQHEDALPRHQRPTGTDAALNGAPCPALGEVIRGAPHAARLKSAH